MDQETLVDLTADIVASQVANNATPIGDVSRLVEIVYRALSGLHAIPDEPHPTVPVVPVKSSVKPDFIICLQCGKKQKMLKRHIRTAHGLGPDDYRSAYELPAGYPMIAPNYAGVRRELALASGLGRKPAKAGGLKRTGRASAKV